MRRGWDRALGYQRPSGKELARGHLVGPHRPPCRLGARPCREHHPGDRLATHKVARDPTPQAGTDRRRRGTSGRIRAVHSSDDHHVSDDRCGSPAGRGLRTVARLSPLERGVCGQRDLATQTRIVDPTTSPPALRVQRMRASPQLPSSALRTIAGSQSAAGRLLLRPVKAAVAALAGGTLEGGARLSVKGGTAPALVQTLAVDEVGASATSSSGPSLLPGDAGAGTSPAGRSEFVPWGRVPLYRGDARMISKAVAQPVRRVCPHRPASSCV